ncbi:FtsX-like permease family protein [Cryobacterium sp. BB736]|uniref:FtsX-like permease family protein n=1 Tax=Cryobacterium sp. BB736 TaxID=2746963 RepID=UPI001874B254|nr:FtsX-like permease family protein [Cryobacterium sp. BB736]
MSGSRTGTGSLLWRHLSARPAAGITVAVLVLLLAALATAGPRAVAVLNDAALGYELGRLSAPERDLVDEDPQWPANGPSESGETGYAPDVEAALGGFAEALERVRHEAGDSLRSALGTGKYILRSGAVPLVEAPRELEIGFAADPLYESRVQFIEGTTPRPIPPLPMPLTGDDWANFDPAQFEIPPMEVALSAEAAARMGWAVGEARTIMYMSNVPVPAERHVVLSGTFTAIDPDDEFWDHATSILDPFVFDDGNLPPTVTGTGFVHPGTIYGLGVHGQGAGTKVWFPLATDAITVDNANAILAEVRKYTSVGHTISTGRLDYGIRSVFFTADVIPPLELALERNAATNAVLAMTAAGPLGVGAAVLFLGCRMIATGRGSALRLLSARGASGRQLRRLSAIEGLVVGVPAGIIGVALGVLLVGGAFSPLQLVLPLIVAIAPAVVLVALSGSVIESIHRTDVDTAGSGRFRKIAELVLALLAVAAVIVLLQRGLTTSASTVGIDPLLAATPLLLSLLGCVLALRLYPLPLTALHERARRGNPLGSFLGTARALRDPSAGLVPVLALVVGVSVAISSVILLSTLRTGVDTAARMQVGGDLQVSGSSFTIDQHEQLTQVDGVDVVAGISGAEPATLDVAGERGNATVFVIDGGAVRQAQGDQPGLLPPGVDLAVQEGQPVPILVSSSVADDIDGRTELRLNSVPVEVADSVGGITPIGARANWIVIDRAAFDLMFDGTSSNQTFLIGLSDSASTEQVVSSIRALLGDAVRIDSPASVSAAFDRSPAVSGLQAALLLAIAITALLSTIAVVMTLVLGTASRERLLALLSTLGASRRVGRGLIGWELGPIAVTALVVGSLLGVGLPFVVLAGVDLRGFTGGTLQPAYAVDPLVLVGALLGFLLATAALTAVSLMVTRRARAATVLRTVEEG